MVRFAVLSAFAASALITPAAAQADNIAKGVDAVASAANGIAADGGLWGKVAIVALGLAIAIALAQGWALVTLFKRLNDVQEKRAAEGVDAAKQVAQTSIAGTGAMADSSSRVASLQNQIQALSDKLSRLPDDLGRGLANQERISGEVRANGDVMRDVAKDVDTTLTHVDTLSNRVDAVLRMAGRPA